MNGSSKLKRNSNKKLARGKQYAAAIGAGALAGSVIGPWGTLGGGVGVAAGCLADYFFESDEQLDPDEE